ncbi:MAG: hypothetical protein OXI27_00580 [Thaumarchaeota archaeon]|nr:hypothetical protein [Nitrososphaerota archaeon]
MDFDVFWRRLSRVLADPSMFTTRKKAILLSFITMIAAGMLIVVFQEDIRPWLFET